MRVTESSAVTPIVIARECGGFLAVSPVGFRLQIGVEGDTEEEARHTFEARLASGLRILAEAKKSRNDKDPTTVSS